VESKTKDENTLRKYLLGEMSAEQQEELELWLMSDEEAYDLLVAAEDDLVDDSLAGKLTREESSRFNSHFLAAPERRRKLQFGRSFDRFVSSRQTARKPSSFWVALGALLDSRPAVRYAVPALVLLIALGGVWSVSKIVTLQKQLNSATSQLAEAGRQRDELRQQLDESRSLGERMRGQVQALEETITAVKSSRAPETLLAFNLIPGISRSSTQIPNLAIPANARLVQFSLTLLDDNYPSYRAALIDANGQELWTRDRLTATATREGKAVVLTVPAELLSNGDYSFRLSGVSDSQTPESIGSFYFRSVRR